MDKPALESALNCLEIGLVVFGAITAVGVAGESINAIRIWWTRRKINLLRIAGGKELLERSARGDSSEVPALSMAGKLETRIETIEQRLLIFGIVVAIGVSGEAVLGTIHFLKTDRLRIIDRQEARQLELRISELTKAAEDERLARAKIEERVAPRHLTVVQQETLVADLQPFAGQEVILFGDTSFKEIGDIMDELAEKVRRPAQWNVLSKVGDRALCSGQSGIVIWASSNADERVMKAANSLASALNAAGLESTVMQQSSFCVVGPMVSYITEFITDARLMVHIFNK